MGFNSAFKGLKDITSVLVPRLGLAFAALVQWNPCPSFLYAGFSCWYHSFNLVRI